MKNFFSFFIAVTFLATSFTSTLYAQKTFIPKSTSTQTNSPKKTPKPSKKNTKTPTPIASKKTDTYPNVARLLDLAEKHMGVPYKWGGSTTKGFDCSGYVQYVFRDAQTNHQLKRVSKDQSKDGKKVCLKKVQKGDLVFFGDKKKDITHVGLVVSGKKEPLKMIHASSSKGVTITNVSTSSYWLPKLQKARRVLNKYELKMVNAKSKGQLKRATKRYLKRS